MKDHGIEARHTGGYSKRPKDYITVEECVILIHDAVNKAIARERERQREERAERRWHRRLLRSARPRT